MGHDVALGTETLTEIAADAAHGVAAAPVYDAPTRLVGLSRRGTGYATLVKPLADRVLGALLLLLLAPLVLVVMGLVRLKLGSGVVYRQRRVGKDDRIFTMYKFRTMGLDRRSRPEPYHGVDRRVRHKCDEDPRHTQFGQTLRKWSLDELPQLWNVVVGDMSLIGPRPELVNVATKHDLWGHPRNLVKPGITGLWQISPHRSELLHKNLEYDLAYVSDVTLWNDLKVLIQTPKAVLQRRGR